MLQASRTRCAVHVFELGGAEEGQRKLSDAQGGIEMSAPGDLAATSLSFEAPAEQRAHPSRQLPPSRDPRANLGGGEDLQGGAESSTRPGRMSSAMHHAAGMPGTVRISPGVHSEGIVGASEGKEGKEGARWWAPLVPSWRRRLRSSPPEGHHAAQGRTQSCAVQHPAPHRVHQRPRPAPLLRLLDLLRIAPVPPPLLRYRRPGCPTLRHARHWRWPCRLRGGCRERKGRRQDLSPHPVARDRWRCVLPRLTRAVPSLD